MKLSILLVTFNQSEFIEQAIDSILNQNISFDYEVVIADDCSTDDTLELIKNKFSKTSITYSVLDSKSNLGISKNYQRGFKACKGEYIAILEGDDYWTHANRITKHIEFLEVHNECIMSFNRFIVYNEESKKFNFDNKFNKEEITYEYISSQDLASGHKKIGNLSSCVFRNSKKIVWEDKIFDVIVADLFLGIYLGNLGLIVKFNNYMNVYRVHKKGLWSGGNLIENQNKLLDLLNKYDSILDYKYKSEFEIYKQKILDFKSKKKIVGFVKILSLFKRKYSSFK